MSEQDVKATDQTTEKEIVLEVEDQDNSENDVKTDILNEKTETKTATKFVEPKQVVDLTDDERALIVANAKAGLDQPNFNVKFFKNGKYRIIKKKEQPPIVSQKERRGWRSQIKYL